MSDMSRPDYNAERVTNADRQFNADQLFSLKEWMVTISTKLDRMETMLATKAEVSHVREVEVRVGKLEIQQVQAAADQSHMVPQNARMLEDVGNLKTQSASLQSVATYKRWVFGVAGLNVVSAIIAGLALAK
jgi:hypothetical protein